MGRSARALSLINQGRSKVEPITDVREISNIAYGYMASRALFAALELDLFTRLSGAEKSLELLSKETKVSPNLLQPLLTSLVSVGLVVLNETTYSNAPASEAYLVHGATRDFSDYLRFVVGKANYSFMGELEKALRGERKPLVGGYYSSWYADPQDAEQFTRAQHRGSLGPATVLARQTDLGKRRSLLDIGGGSGAFTIALCQRNTKLTATILDFPETVEVAKRYVAEAGLQERITHLPGNALGTDWPNDHEVILMSYLWSAVRGAEIEVLAKRAYAALPPGGMVLIHDFMVDDGLNGPPTAAFHLLILALDNPEMVSLTPSFVAKRLSDVGFRNVTADTLIPGITSLAIGYKL